MRQDRLDRLRQQLLGDRNRLQKEVARSAKTRQGVGCAADDTQYNLSHSVNDNTEDFEIRAATEEALRAEYCADVDALERLDSGTFGDCEHCGVGIAIKRLNAISYATSCIRCAR